MLAAAVSNFFIRSLLIKMMVIIKMLQQ